MKPRRIATLLALPWLGLAAHAGASVANILLLRHFLAELSAALGNVCSAYGEP